MLTKVLAIETAKHAIRVNSVHPGWTTTAMLGDSLDDPEAQTAQIRCQTQATDDDRGASATDSWKALGFSDEDLANGGSDRFVDALVGWGEEAALRKRIDEHLSAGATQVCIKPLAPGGGTDMRIIETLAPAG